MAATFSKLSARNVRRPGGLKGLDRDRRGDRIAAVFLLVGAIAFLALILRLGGLVARDLGL
jgi:hypothetical protein